MIIIFGRQSNFSIGTSIVCTLILLFAHVKRIQSIKVAQPLPHPKPSDSMSVRLGRPAESRNWSLLSINRFYYTLYRIAGRCFSRSMRAHKDPARFNHLIDFYAEIFFTFIFFSGLFSHRTHFHRGRCENARPACRRCKRNAVGRRENPLAAARFK